ncbi:MAG: DUF4830 domain-containing protein [Acutalibacteraceae bacterium]|nr:DUF4830 domain-containing protein [Acutalibacteraceae bacterium]
MKVYFSVSKNYALMLCIVMLFCFVLLSLASAQRGGVGLKTEEKRTSYLNSMGYGDYEYMESKEVFIPYTFSDKMQRYNAVIKSSGYDLYEYAGNSATLYTYFFENNCIHLLCFEDKLICADLCDFENNNIYPLKERKNG